MEISEAELQPILQCKGRLVVGYSGGRDSHVLLHWLHQLKLEQCLVADIYALHINHGISSQADLWETHCRNICQGLGIPIAVQKVNVSPKGSLEAAARSARYQGFNDFLRSDDLLLLAHHEQDQLETIMLHLLRGDSPMGLKGMTRQRRLATAQLLRPLLSVTAKDVQLYAEKYALLWVEDQSNQDVAMDRNYIRNNVMPILHQRWPQLSTTWLSALKRTNEGVAELEAIAEQDLQAARENTGADGSIKVSVIRLRNLSQRRQINLFRLMFRLSGMSNFAPEKLLVAGIHDLLQADSDKMPMLQWQGMQVRRFRQSIYLLPCFAAVSSRRRLLADLLSGPLANGGLFSSSARQSDPPGLKLENRHQLTVGYRQGGETMQFARRRSLKNVFQENQIPGFLRDYIPLIFHGDELVAICGMIEWGLPFIVIPAYQSKLRSQVLNWQLSGRLAS
ncbi:MAG: tRNA lysidine(34) synthetase TilS [Pseudomonadales bacterium]|nr:tRNA lysidine(34) synthetase TilS [Pseudomonadales bacterium]